MFEVNMKFKIFNLVLFAVLVTCITTLFAQNNPTNSKSLNIDMVQINEGRFTMGSPAGEKYRNDDEDQHTVYVSSFKMSKFEITQREYTAVMGVNPSDFIGEDLPVENVSWFDAIEFCNKLSQMQGLKLYYSINKDEVKILGGKGYRLPTEAEWEYTCRAGTTTPFTYGYYLNSTMANFNGNRPYDSGLDVNREKTSPVGIFNPNKFGIYDMHGNVWEWCWDWYDEDYYKTSPVNNPIGPNTGIDRVVRGGSWNFFGQHLRSASRYGYNSSFKSSYVGFRIAQNL